LAAYNAPVCAGLIGIHQQGSCRASVNKSAEASAKGIESIAYEELVLEKVFDAPPSNGLPFSCRERATTSFQNSTDLVREAVGCNGVFGGSFVVAFHDYGSFSYG
jgi:hypothetical protein